MGYPRRAASLHEAARRIVRDHDGSVPADVSALLALPGIGPYTAAAVTSIAYGSPVAAIDTNVRKVMARLEFAAEPDEVLEADVVDAASRWLDARGARRLEPGGHEPRPRGVSPDATL